MRGLQKLPDPLGSRMPGDPQTLAKVTAAAQIGGGFLLATGRLPRIASAVLAATVIPANLGSHMFWAETDPVDQARKRRDFMTDVSLLGGLVIASADTAGKPSLGWRGRRAAHRVSEAVAVGLAATMPAADGVAERLTDGLHTGAQRGRDLFEAGREELAERSAPLIEAGEQWADDAKSRAKRLLHR